MLPKIRALTFKRNISRSFALPVNQTLEILRATNANFEGLFSHKALSQLWFKQGESIVLNLNQHLSQTSSSLTQDKDYTLQELVSVTINKPDLYNIHKNAAKLYNLTTFFENLRPLQIGPVELDRPGPEAMLQTPTNSFLNVPTDEGFVDWLEDSFGSITEFRNLLINTAKAIKGDGTVWLVAESTLSDNYLQKNISLYNSAPAFSNLSIVATYNGGVVNDSERSGQIKRMKSMFEKEEEDMEPTRSSDADNDDLQLGTTEQAEYETAYLNKKLVPVLAIDASPRNYLVDYGVYGKQKYLENCWECIDWDVVLRRLPERSKQAITM
ncbi:hypothetical protein KGF56_002132 [Candida oxycetoniae]|uniref:Manganese/iron superoxide dismutase C-terminal domain-containing protein n=1 Tax=Candida oxycetoniae TaxID=497107 RepID=A0AAI9SXY6_9ASCO|nr:uncharacterized protein KGF56_002132 [Candida oxycetoniae]KAI3405047.2 hypothetical protein KGF56_002132 [Candida oxycetoniae]